MKQNFLYLLKAFLFSALLLLFSVLLLSFLMMQTGWGDSVMYPMLIFFFCLSVFLGGRYFAGHAPARRFLWGICYGIACFLLYSVITYFLRDTDALLSEHAVAFFLSSLVSGCIGGMLS